MTLGTPPQQPLHVNTLKDHYGPADSVQMINIVNKDDLSMCIQEYYCMKYLTTCAKSNAVAN